MLNGFKVPEWFISQIFKKWSKFLLNLLISNVCNMYFEVYPTLKKKTLFCVNYRERNVVMYLSASSLNVYNHILTSRYFVK